MTFRAYMAGGLATGLIAFGCGEERSAQAYCDAMWDKAIPLHDEYQAAADNMEADPLSGMLKLFSSPRDLAGMFDSMSKSAPEEIRTDTEAVRDSFDKLADSYGETLTNPLGGLAASLGNALSVNGAMQRVDAYTTEHCGTPAEAIAERS